MPEPQPIAFVDKYEQEWIFMLREDVKEYTYKGIPIIWLGKESEDKLKDKPKVSFLDIPISPKREDRRRSVGSMEPKVLGSPCTGGIGESGESDLGGSKRTSVFPRPRDSKGALGKSTPELSRKVRPSQFWKWVKKYNGSADPYDHLAPFR